jgi:uncharacterized membrane protein YesL
VDESGYPPLTVVRLALRDWWRDWLSLTVLNLVWMLAWVTVLLGPPATLAVYDYLRRHIEGDAMTPGEVWGSVRAHALKGWLWALLNLALALGVLVNLGFYGGFDALWARGLELLTLMLTGLWLVLQFYALPYLMVQERRSLRLAYRNALFTTLASPLYSLLLTLTAGLLLTVSVRFVALLFLAVPVLVALLGTHAVRERLRHFKVLKRQT